uniref:Uncharacterized protein n=1 Tax=Avena sativa TaxID=4498 RepID=A0ACD5TEK6_AVESA
MSLSKPFSARRLVPALFPLAHADAASAAASRRDRRRGAFVSTPPAPPPSPSSAAVPPTAATHALYLSALAARRLPDSALLHLRQIARPGSPVPPSPTAYRVVVKCLLADNSRLDDAIKLKDEMLASGFVGPDPHVYSLLMAGCVQASDGAKALELYQELQDKLGGEPVLDGIVYGNLMKAYFLMGTEEKATECYEEVLGPESEVRFGAESYNQVLDALGQNKMLEHALKLFDRMLTEHDPSLRIAVDVRSFSVMADAYCAAGRFEDAIVVFRRMGEYKVVPDVAAYNNLIWHLGLNRLVDEAEVLHKEMGEQSLVADEETYVLLMDACFRAERTDDGVGYFDKISQLGLKPDASHYHKIVDGLVGLSLLDRAQVYFDQMREKEIGPSIATYESLLKAYVGVTRLDDAAKVAKGILLDEKVVFRDEMRELLEGVLQGEGREDDIAKLYEDVEREKAEAAVRAAEEKARAVALAREERAARRAEAAAKDEAAAKASAAAIEAILGHRRKTEGETEAATSAPNALDGGILSRLGLSSSGQGALQDTPLSTEPKGDSQEPF